MNTRTCRRAKLGDNINKIPKRIRRLPRPERRAVFEHYLVHLELENPNTKIRANTTVFPMHYKKLKYWWAAFIEKYNAESLKKG